MKTICKFLVAAAAVFFLTNDVIAQASFGFRGGFNAAYITDFPAEISETDIQKEFMHGKYATFFFEILATSMFSIQPELSYLQKGGRIEFRDYEDAGFKVKLDYLELPLLAKLRMGSGPMTGYFIAGPSVGYALRGETQVEYDEIEDEDTYIFDNSYGDDGRKDNRWDFSAVAGLGLQYKLGPGNLLLDARTVIDLNDFSKFQEGKSSGHKAILSRNALISVGYQIPLVGAN